MTATLMLQIDISQYHWWWERGWPILAWPAAVLLRKMLASANKKADAMLERQIDVRIMIKHLTWGAFLLRYVTPFVAWAYLALFAPLDKFFVLISVVLGGFVCIGLIGDYAVSVLTRVADERQAEEDARILAAKKARLLRRLGNTDPADKDTILRIQEELKGLE